MLKSCRKSTLSGNDLPRVFSNNFRRPEKRLLTQEQQVNPPQRNSDSPFEDVFYNYYRGPPVFYNYRGPPVFYNDVWSFTYPSCPSSATSSRTSTVSRRRGISSSPSSWPATRSGRFCSRTPATSRPSARRNWAARTRSSANLKSAG